MDKNTLHALLRKMVETDASDLFLTVGAPPHIKVQGESWPLSVPPLQSGQAQALAYSIMSAQQIADFERQLEANLSYTAPDIGRFRVSVYRQRGETAMVARLIHATIPDFESLGLPPVVQDLALLRRGLLLVVGAAGSGKSTTLASMIDHRAHHSQGHIFLFCPSWPYRARVFPAVAGIYNDFLHASSPPFPLLISFLLMAAKAINSPVVKANHAVTRVEGSLPIRRKTYSTAVAKTALRSITNATINLEYRILSHLGRLCTYQIKKPTREVSIKPTSVFIQTVRLDISLHKLSSLSPNRIEFSSSRRSRCSWSCNVSL